MAVYDVCEELTVRGVDFSDCFEEAALRARLGEARARAPPAAAEALDGVHRNAAEGAWRAAASTSATLTADDLPRRGRDEDGALPGGLDAEAAVKLVQDPEVMALLQSPDFQEVMQDVMGGGPDAMVKHMADPNKAAMLSKCGALAMLAAGLAPPAAAAAADAESRARRGFGGDSRSAQCGKPTAAPGLGADRSLPAVADGRQEPAQPFGARSA